VPIVAKPGALLGLVLVVVALFYANVTGANFCGYDDFNEAYRAEFFDAKDPSRILTTPHFVKYMYRPVTSGLQYATWELGGHAAPAFRIRDLAMHLAAVAAVFGIVMLIVGSEGAAAGAALLFGLDPSANEAVVVAIWTNTTAYALLLGSFFFFLWSLRALDRDRNWFPMLLGSLVLALVALFTYEPTIVVFALIFGYLLLLRFQDRTPAPAYLACLGAGSVLVLGVFFGVRHLLAIQGTAVLPLALVARNLAIYLVGLVLPVDLVLGNALFGIPLPGSGAAFSATMILPSAVFAIVLGLVFWLVNTRWVARQHDAYRRDAFGRDTFDWRLVTFFALAIPVTLVPIVLFRPHASEFNLYVPAALYATLSSIVLWRFARSSAAYWAVIGLLLLSYAGGTVVKNQRVIACGRVAAKILGGLPIAHWRQGVWHIALATPATERLTPRYGIYDYSGVETLEVPSSDIRGAQEAVRLASGNENVSVAIVRPGALRRACVRPDTCFWVLANGDVKER
jgi:hypothetical protein